MPLLNPSKGWSSSTSRLLALYSFLFVAWSSILMGVLYYEVSTYLDSLAKHSLMQRQHLFAHRRCTDVPGHGAHFDVRRQGAQLIGSGLQGVVVAEDQ